LDHAEKLIKALQDADMQLVECVTRIWDLVAKKELKDKELEEHKGAVQVIIDMVDPLEEGVNSERTLLKRLREAPKKIFRYISKSTKT
jgi:hypothetical protein